MKKLAIVLAIALVAVGIWAITATTGKNGLQTQIDDLKAQVAAQADAAGELETVQADLAAAQAALEEVQAQFEANQAELETTKAELETARTDLTAAQTALEEMQAAAPAEEPAEVGEPVEETVEAPTAEPTEAPAEEPAAETVEEPAEEPAAETAEAPAEEPVQTAANAQPAEKTEITIWHTFTDAQDAMLNEIANDFNASQDQYTVLVQSQTYQGFLDNVYNAVANKVGPNIIINYASTAADYVKDGLVVDLSQYIYDEEIGMADIIASLPAAILEEATGFEGGGMYALPAVSTGPILFYNKTLFDELNLTVPTTWEEVAQTAKAIYEATGTAGFAADSLTDMMQALMIQSGAGYIDVENKCVLFDTEAATEWLKWFGENVQAGYFALNPTGDYWSNDFNAKLVASYLGSCAGVPYIEPDGFEYAVAPMVKSIETGWFPSWNRGPIVFNVSEEANLGAYEFVKFFLQPENNAKWAIAMNALSPYGTTQEDEAYKAYAETLDPSLIAVQDNLDVAGALPSVTGSYAVREALKEAAVMVAGGMDAAEAMANCVTASNAALQG